VVRLVEEKTLENARRYFSTGYNCAQTVFRCVLEERGILIDHATDIAAGLGAGVSYQGVTCGAVSGAILALGVLNGLEETDFNAHRKKTYTDSQVFMSKFRNAHETIVCNELVGIDIGDPDARRKASDEGVFRTLCPEFIQTAIETVLEIKT
jgi:C_GCAxxG_C_C family probable redox protein